MESLGLTTFANLIEMKGIPEFIIYCSPAVFDIP